MRISVTLEWVALVLLATLVAGSGLLLGRHFLVILALSPTIVAVVSLMVPFRVPHAKVHRTLDSSRAAQGDPVEVEIEILHRKGPACYVELRQRLERTDPPSGRLRGVLDPDHPVSLRYSLRLPRGHYDFPPITLRFLGGLGLRFGDRRYPAPAELTVWPSSEEIEAERLLDNLVTPIGKIGMSATTRSGNGTEWLGVRSYQRGDPLRRINWRSWAKTQQLFTNDFAFERSIDVWIVLDARRRSNVHKGDESLFEHSVSAAASLCRGLIESGNRVALYVYGSVIDDFVPLGAGPRQVQRFMDRLTSVTPAHHVAFSTFSNFPTNLIRPLHKVCIVSPLAEGDAELLERLAIVGYRLTILSPDPVAYLEPDPDSDAAAYTAWRISRLEREAELISLMKSGCAVVDWDTEQPLSAVIHAVRSGAR